MVTSSSRVSVVEIVAAPVVMVSSDVAPCVRTSGPASRLSRADRCLSTARRLFVARLARFRPQSRVLDLNVLEGADPDVLGDRTADLVRLVRHPRAEHGD